MNKLLYRVIHAFDGHEVGKQLDSVDPARVASNHVVPVLVDEGNGPLVAKVDDKPAKEPKA